MKSIAYVHARTYVRTGFFRKSSVSSVCVSGLPLQTTIVMPAKYYSCGCQSL